MSSVEWVARRVGDDILCGRRHVSGDYNCTGPIATIFEETGGVHFPPGIHQDPERPGWWVPTKGSARRMRIGHVLARVAQ